MEGGQGGGGRGTDLVSHTIQLAGKREELLLLLERANGQENVLLRESKGGGEEGLEVGLVLVLSKAGHLSGGGHFHSHNGVGTRKPRKRELWDLDGDVVDMDRRVRLNREIHLENSGEWG